MARTITSLESPYMDGFPDHGGTKYYLDPYAGRDSWDGRTRDRAFKTWQRAYDALTTNKGDSLVYYSYDSSSGWALLPTATVNGDTDGFDFAKNNCHIYGVAVEGGLEGRASIRLGTGDTTTVTMFTVSGYGNTFDNIDFLMESAVVAQKAVTVTGYRNLFNNCTIAGMVHATSAANANSRSLLIDGGGTGTIGANKFVNCQIGINTILRGNVACAEIEVKGAAARNQFEHCTILTLATAGGTNANLFLYVPSAGIQDYVSFQDCKFINSFKQSGAGLMAVAMTVHTSSGGVVWLQDSYVGGVVAAALQTANNGNILVNGVGGAATGGRMIVATG